MTELHWIVISAMVGAVLYGVATWFRSERRNEAGRCARCGVKLSPESQVQVPFDVDRGRKGNTVAMCPKCAELTLHNHRYVYRLFVVAAVACFAATAWIVVTKTMGAVRIHRFSGGIFVLPMYIFSTAGGLLYYARSVKRSLDGCSTETTGDSAELQLVASEELENG